MTVGDYAVGMSSVDHREMEISTRGLRHPIATEIQGQQCTLLTIGHVALALGRTTWTVRYWTRLGLLPQAPFDVYPDDPRRRRRLFPEAYVVALAEIAEQGYMDPRLERGQWRRFQLDVWRVYEETVVPLTDGVVPIGGVADDGCTSASTEEGGQVISSVG